ncbi:MAG: flagellar motor protein MotD [Gammaproteobacteria bacterium]|nr:flagellar motor protein MotD [Gammaproteobacteria bacterium]
MARKKPHEEHENHERWLVSYADFITLLFAFFVVMYSISSVNEGKYRVLSDALVSAFRSSQKSLMPIQVGQNVKSPSSSASAPEFMRSPQMISTPANMRAASGGLIDDDTGTTSKGRGGLDKLSRKVAAVMAKLIDEGLVVIHRKKNWVEVVIKDSFLFSAGTANILPQAQSMLDKVAVALHDVTNPMRVEGYTDDQLVHSDLYPSNWELSLARAVTVIKQFEHNGIASWRMSATGYGQFRPDASNSTAEGRAKNRRVAIIIMASHATEADYDVQKSAETEQQMNGDQAGTAANGGNGVESPDLKGAEIAKNESANIVAGGAEGGVLSNASEGGGSGPTPSTITQGDVMPPPIRLPPPIKLPIAVPR